MSASPKFSRTYRTGEGGEAPEGPRSSRSGLSEYTSQRLAELRARRAELEATSDYKTTAPSSAPSSDYKSSTPSSDYKSSATSSDYKSSAISSDNKSVSSSTPSADLLESYRSRRGLTGSTTSATTNGTNGTNGTAGKEARENGSPGGTPRATPRSAVGSTGAGLSSRTGGSTVPAGVKETGGGAGRAEVATRTATGDGVSRSASSLHRSNSRRADTDDDECVGFASLPEQVHRKAIKRGFDFTVMVVGEAGLGKSTLVSSLFLNESLYKDRAVPAVQERLTKTVSIEKKYMEIEERGVKLRLTIVDTPGFNDSVNAENSWKPVEDYVNQQFDQYYQDESGLNRKNIKDNRVHCCLYFVSPYGHGLRQTDVQFMKRLHDKVNIVPVIAKADCLTQGEIRRLKAKVLQEIEHHRIRIYEFPECDEDEDEEFKKQDKELKAAIPFAVIGSNTIVEAGGKRVRGRLYPWGIVEVDNPQHCDFTKLRQMLISTHMQDLKDVTRDVHYENFRARHIKEQMTRQQRERNHLQELTDYRRSQGQSKLKRDSSPNFEVIMDADKLLEQKDEEIRRMQEMLMKMQAQLAANTTGKPNGQVNGLGNL